MGRPSRPRPPVSEMDAAHAMEVWWGGAGRGGACEDGINWQSFTTCQHHKFATGGHGEASQQESGSQDAHDVPKYCDVELMVQGQKFHTNRWLLASHSSVLKDLLESTNNTTLTLADDKAETMQQFLRQLCPMTLTDQKIDSIDEAAELLELARKYDVKILNERCESFCIEQTKTSQLTCLARMAVLADTYKLQSLRQHVIPKLQLPNSMDGLKKELLRDCGMDTVLEVMFHHAAREREHSRSLRKELSHLHSGGYD
eukprot:jgi/Chlat1/1743/Chrsp13S02168